jgi:valyl-tRNA synthetase
MTEKRQTSQGYIIRILQHFATKLWNITNFVMLFQAVMNCPDQNFSYKGKGPFQSGCLSK